MSKKRKYQRNGETIFINTRAIFMNKKLIQFDHDFSKFGDKSFLEQFPLIDDFTIILRFHEQDINFIYYSESNGILSFFPYGHIKGANISDIASMYIPTGTIEKPYFDAGQGGSIYIFEKQKYIYIMNSGEDINMYSRYYRVNKEIYYNSWSDAIEWVKDNGQVD
jgi:hypothetical protein